MLCFIAEKKLPYNLDNTRFIFDYYIGVGLNPKQAHLKAIEYHLKKPVSLPDERMITHPIWSTWAKYKVHINASVIEKYANEIIEHKFKNSQLEIDDDWEECYGSLKIDTEKFPDMKELINRLKEKGFRVTLWVHPFINKDCQPWYDEAIGKGYLVLNHEGSPDTSWWNSGPGGAGYIDFTNPDASKWFTNRLEILKTTYGIDSFKFDAGESGHIPINAVLKGDKKYHPGIISKIYAEDMSQFGGMIEVRTGWGTQYLPVFVRMLDKNSNWAIEDNGLGSVVTTLLQFNMNGYPFVLPDMVGGNQGTDKEMFLRWLAANIFMPTIQYSFVPWDFDDETIELSHKLTDLHADIASPAIIDAMRQAVKDGTPVNPPIWWIAPNDKVAHAIGDQFMLGESILIAPILKKDQTTRNIYLPDGNWKDSNGISYKGPIWINDYPVPLGVIPYFLNENHHLYGIK